MASRRLLTDTVRLFNFISEVNDEAVYQESIIRYCYCPTKKGITNTSPSDSALLYIFDENTIVESRSGVRRTYVTPEEWESENCIKEDHFTLSDEGKDYFLKCDEKKFFIQHVSHKVAGSPRMHHFEVEGK